MTIKPGPRVAILSYLAVNGLSVLADIMAGINEPKRERVQSNLSAAVQDELVSRRRDDVSNQPAYEITKKGREALARLSGDKPPSAPKPAAVAAQQVSAPAPIDQTEQLRESRANELALSQTITEVCCALGADPAKTTTRELVELAKKAHTDLERALEKITIIDSVGKHAHTELLDTRQRLDQATQQSLKDIDLLTEKNRKLHEELEHLRTTPPAAATLVEARTPTGYAVFDSTGGTTRHKRIEGAHRSAARSIRAGASQADVVATYIVARARRGVQIDKV